MTFIATYYRLTAIDYGGDDRNRLNNISSLSPPVTKPLQCNSSVPFAEVYNSEIGKTIVNVDP